MVPDSAATASAIYTGVKTTSFTLGFDSHVVWNDTSSIASAKKMDTVLQWAQKAGKKTGD